MYRQYDGYPSGHGQELADYLKTFRITNGISGDPINTANGMACLAAQIVAHFKGGGAFKLAFNRFIEALKDATKLETPKLTLEAITTATKAAESKPRRD